MEAQVPKIPLRNRIVFSVIAAFFIAGPLKMVFHFYLGADALPPTIWIPAFGLAIVGFILLAAKGDVRFRLHRIWTPVGLAMIAWTVLDIVFYEIPHSNGVLDALVFNVHTTEGVPYAIGLGLLLAFVDLAIFYKYAYYFVTLAGFNLIFIAVYIVLIFPMMLLGKNTDFENFEDMIWLSSGVLFAYYIRKRLKADHPTRRQVLRYSVIFVSVVAVIIVGAYLICGLPFLQNTWLAHWFRYEGPLHNASSEKG